MSDQNQTNTPENQDEADVLLGLLRDSFPGRSDSQLIPIGMVYAGERWGRDFRFAEVPEQLGKALTSCNSSEDVEFYLTWLTDHLRQLKGEPTESQKGIYELIGGMIPQDAALMLGMHAALYQMEIEAMEIHLNQNHSFEEYLKEEKELMPEEDLEDLDEEHQRQLYAQVKEETSAWLEMAPGIGHIDIPWRLLLAKAVQGCETAEEQQNILDIFYGSFFQYVEGLVGEEE